MFSPVQGGFENGSSIPLYGGIFQELVKLEVSDEFQSLPKGEPEVSMQVRIYRVGG